MVHNFVVRRFGPLLLPPHSMPLTGMVLDCGSGHTSILWYEMSLTGQIRQIRRSKLKVPAGGNFKITDAFEVHDVAPSASVFADAISVELDDAKDAGIDAPGIVVVGATGGLRNMLHDGRVTTSQLLEYKALLLSGLRPSSRRVTKFEVISGEQEAAWELRAANIIFGPKVRQMFPGASKRARRGFGLFSGGGSSVQVQAGSGPPLSYPLSTWCGPEMDEALGATLDAWRQPETWARWELALLAKIEEAKASLQGRRFDGCFVLTAMNHVAASAAGFAETPIQASEAICRLDAALDQFRAAVDFEGAAEPCKSFVGGRHSMHPTVSAWYSSQSPHHLARVGALHICRLRHALCHLFEPGAMLFAPPATESSGDHLDCEWTLQCFALEAHTLMSPPMRSRRLRALWASCYSPIRFAARTKNSARRSSPGPIVV